jgi:hypothetical protein
MKGYNGYRWQIALGRFYRVSQMVNNVIKRFVGIVKVGCQLGKACNPTRTTFKGTKGTIKF